MINAAKKMGNLEETLHFWRLFGGAMSVKAGGSGDEGLER